MFLLSVVLFILSFISCSTTGGAVGVEWGQETGNGHHHKVKKAKKGRPPPHAPAHGYRTKYNYRYYPACSVYYDSNRELYFYIEGANWRISASLPHAVQLGLGEYVSIEMDEDKPYINYQEHKRRYPPGKFKKKDKRKKK
jgi:hypothetical protein